MERDIRITDKLTQNHLSVDDIKRVLKQEGLLFSDDSVRNIAYGLMVFKEICGQSIGDIFFIYGSTAKGIAGIEPKLQEIQYWMGEHFLGSTFRTYGMSDLDIRCISQRPEKAFETINKAKDNLSPFALRPAGIRIESFKSVEESITKTSETSFFRRVLLLNSPIVLSGRNDLDILIGSGGKYLIQDDLDYERELKAVKQLARTRLEGTPAIFIAAQDLIARYPVFYSNDNLLTDNRQRSNSYKVSFSLRESSLIMAKVSEEADCERYHTKVYQNPNIPFESIRQMVRGGQ